MMKNNNIMKIWIARDHSGLWAFSEKPDKKVNIFGMPTIYCKVYQLDSELFPEITFENSPQLIEIKFIKAE